MKLKLNESGTFAIENTIISVALWPSRQVYSHFFPKHQALGLYKQMNIGQQYCPRMKTTTDTSL